MTTSGEIVIKEVSGITRVLEYEMQSEVLSHPTARLVCEIEKDFNTRVFLNSDTMFHIEQREPHENLFTGYADEVSIEEQQKDYFILSLTLRAGSVLLDKKVNYRSCQNVSAMYADIVNKVAEEIPQVFVKCEIGEDKAIEKPLIQYGETNWEFIKRVASKRAEPVFVDEAEVEPKVYVGHLAGGSSGEFAGRCIAEGMSDRYYRMGDFSMGYGKSAYYYYKASSEKSYRVGQQVNFLNGKFYIFAKEAKLVQEEIQYTYKLVRDAYLRVPVFYNMQFAGATILGKIEETSGETLKLKLQLKDEKDSSDLYAYDWKPEVGNLMYCMPQKGTTVSLYFPSNNEQEAYAINCIRKGGERVFEASAKTFLTEDSKFMVMAPEAMHFCAVPKQPNIYSQLSLVDDMEMVLASSGGISLTTSKGIAMSGPTIDLFSGGKAAFGVGTVAEVEEQEKISWMIDNFTATLEVSPALLNVYAETVTRFLIFGAADGERYPVIMDVPETSEVAVGALIRNAVIGVFVTAAVVAACVFALPAVLGFVGVATATATTVATGAAIGAATTGVFAIREQWNKDKERGVVTTLSETFADMLFKTVTGAIEGGATAFFGGKATKLGTKFLLNQASSAITTTGDVALNSVKGLIYDEYYYNLGDVADAYGKSIVDGAVSTGLDLSIDGLVSIKNTEVFKNLKQKSGDVLNTKFGGTKWYKGLTDLADGVKKYSNLEEVGHDDAEFVWDRNNRRDHRKNAIQELKDILPEQIADANLNVSDALHELTDMRELREELKEKMRKGEGNISSLKYQLKELKRQIKYQDEEVYQKALRKAADLEERRETKEALVRSLKSDIWESMKDSWELRGKAVAAGSLIKMVQDTIKNGENEILEEVEKLF